MDIAEILEDNVMEEREYYEGGGGMDSMDDENDDRRGGDHHERPDSPSMNHQGESKKIRLEEGGYERRARNSVMEPSKVIFVRQLPFDIKKSEIEAFFSVFGTVIYVLQLRNKGQAFVEMESLELAQKAIEHFKEQPAILRGRRIYLEYSSRKELERRDELPNGGDRGNGSRHVDTLRSRDNGLRTRNAGTRGTAQEGPPRVLSVLVLDVRYPVTVDTLYTIFSNYGIVQKIHILPRAEFQALVQFENASQASIAHRSLDNRNIYAGCCQLRIEFSPEEEIVVRYNNETMRDFTSPNLPGGAVLPNIPGAPLANRGYGGSSSYDAYHMSSDYSNRRSSNGRDGYERRSPSPGYSSGRHPLSSDSEQLDSVLLVNNLDESIRADTLFFMFGVFGDVLRVKILFNKRDTALIQFRTAEQASLALKNLNNLLFRGKKLAIAVSQHRSVNPPRPDTEEVRSGLTKDYSDSPLHRYRYANSKNYSHICPPTPTLHVSNLPPGCDQFTLENLFSKYGDIKGFRFFPNTDRMALMQMASTEQALEALIHLHDYPLSPSHHMRVSFSKSHV